MASAAIPGGEWPVSAGMIHGGRLKRAGVLMAGIALRRGRDVCRGLGFNPWGHAMASIATAGDRRGGGRMIEHRTGKGGGAVMADIALGSRCNMVSRFC